MHAVCSVRRIYRAEASVTNNNTESLCSALGGRRLRNAPLTSNIFELNRQLKLVDIRLEGTDE